MTVDGSVEAVERADVLAAEIDVHERRKLTALEELPGERGVAVDEIVEHARTSSPLASTCRSPPTSARSVGGMRTAVMTTPPS